MQLLRGLSNGDRIDTKHDNIIIMLIDAANIVLLKIMNGVRKDIIISDFFPKDVIFHIAVEEKSMRHGGKRGGHDGVMLG